MGDANAEIMFLGFRTELEIVYELLKEKIVQAKMYMQTCILSISLFINFTWTPPLDGDRPGHYLESSGALIPVLHAPPLWSPLGGIICDHVTIWEAIFCF